MTTAAEQDVLYPLSLFWRGEGRPMPAVEVITAAELPEPYRRLLAHNGDMTSRLEEFHGSVMTLRVLHREVTAEVCRREVLLCARQSGLPVEYGAIEICLPAFSPALRELILAGRQPLGGLLNEHRVDYRSEPRAFLRLAPDEALSGLFGAGAGGPLYGRSNRLLGGAGECLARIVEVLRPGEAPGA